MLKVEPTPVVKFTQSSKNHRTEGNKEFQNKNYKAAYDLYTQSCFCAPSSDQDRSLALAYSNRSAALFHMSYYEEAIIDIELALACGFPNETRYKLYDRRGKCLTNLNRIPEALENFQKAVDSVEQSKMNAKQKSKWLEDITNNKNLANNKKSETEQVKGKTAIPPEFETQERIDGACLNVDLEFNEKRGRDLVALENFSVGESVVLQKPYSSISYIKTATTHCHHCCKRSWNLLPSELSAQVGFCSKKCIIEAQPYHSVEYQYLDLLNEKGMERIGHLALRSALIMDMENKKETLSGLGDKSYGVNGEEVKNDYLTVSNLIKNENKRRTQTNLYLSIMTLYLLKIAEKGGFFGTEQQVVPHEAKLIVGVTLMNLIQSVQCNAHAICEQVVNSDFRLCKPVDVGLGLYTTISLVNHSCNPNCEIIFYDNVAHIQATRFIPQGSKITIDYGMVYYLHPKEKRQEILNQQYFFDCSCEACEGNWLLLDDLPSKTPLFKCSKCDTPFPPLETGIDMAAVTCYGCQAVTDLGKVIQELYQFHEMYSRAMDCMVEGDRETYLPIMIKFLMIMDTNICQPWKEYVSCHATIKQCLRLEGSGYNPME